MKKIIDISMDMRDFVFPGDPACTLRGPFNRISGSNEQFVYDLDISTQSGTHVQGPHYFLKDGKKISEFTLDCFMGEAVVIDITKRGEDTGLEEMKTLISIEEGRGKILILRTGHMEELISSQILDPKTRPGLSLESAKYLAEEVKVKMIAIDSVGIESRISKNYEVNVYLCKREVLLLECLTNLSAIHSRHVWLSAVPIRIDGVEGAPCRAYVLEEREGTTLTN